MGGWLALDGGYCGDGVALAVAGFLLVGAFGAELVDEEFVALLHGFGDFEGDLGAFDVGGTEFGVAVGGAQDEDFVDFDFVANFGFAAVVEVDVD